MVYFFTGKKLLKNVYSLIGNIFSVVALAFILSVIMTMAWNNQKFLLLNLPMYNTLLILMAFSPGFLIRIFPTIIALIPSVVTYTGLHMQKS
jgi:hypothetical protein